MKIQTLPVVLAFVLLAPAAAWAQSPWTAAPGSGAIDEQSVGIYQADPASLRYNTSGSTAPIIAYYNVTDTTGTGAPGWTTIELGAYDPSTSSQVTAQVYRFKLTGGVSMIGGCWSQEATLITKWQCPLPPINFNDGSIYAIAVSITRSNTSVSPLFTGVRLF